MVNFIDINLTIELNIILNYLKYNLILIEKRM